MRYSVNPYIILPKTTIKFILKIMKTAIYTLVLLAATLIYGGEKSDRNEEDSDTGNDTGTGWNDEIVPDTVFKGFLTVEEAAPAEVGSLINVRGYIVGSTSRNIYNAIVRPPFESRTSLILADKRLTEVEAFYEDDLFPVRLTDYKDTQRALNLVDNPEHWNKRVYIFGQKCSYMGMPGLEKIMKYEFIE